MCIRDRPLVFPFCLKGKTKILQPVGLGNFAETSSFSSVGSDTGSCHTCSRFCRSKVFLVSCWHVILFSHYTLPPNAIRFLFVKVETLVGFPPGLPAARFRLTALAFCELDIRVAFASGTHFGYFLLLPFDLPQG